MPEQFKSINMDANETMFFSRQLESIKARSFDVEYPEFPATRVLPVSTDAGAGAQSITYRQFDSVGLMKLIASYADDLPRSDVFGKEFTTPVRSLGGSYGYSVQEIRSAMMAGVPLQQRKANAARQAYEQAVNNIAFFGDGSATYGGLYGLFYNPNVTKAAATNGSWATATPDEIIEDVNKAITNVTTLTKGVETIDTVLLPLTQYGRIASTPRSGTSDTTILEFLRRVWPGVTFTGINECAALATKPSGGAGPVDVMVLLRNSLDKMSLEIPQPFEQFPPQERNLEVVVPTHGRIGGLIVYYPLSVAIIEGI